jgi:hypothetical protein
LNERWVKKRSPSTPHEARVRYLPDDPIPTRIRSGWNPTIALSSGVPYIRHMISSTMILNPT